MSSADVLETELELISSSLLPAESIEDSGPAWPRVINITSAQSKLYLHVIVEKGYPIKGAVTFEVKGTEMGRDEAEGWRDWVISRDSEWDASEDYPLYQILTAHFLPLLAPSSPSPPPTQPFDQSTPSASLAHHCLLTSHHLLSPTKRKNLLALSSQLSVLGFSKTGHPGIMYAVGTSQDLTEWLREVKSWNWLALRVRVAVEPLGEHDVEELSGRGKEDGARGGKGRGDWLEVEKIAEALEWLKRRGREQLLLDVGMGAGGAK